MPMMNVGMQRRIGKLPKTPEYGTPAGSGYYGYGHRGFGNRRPTPTSPGFFGLGSTLYGDGKVHIYGNDGNSALPANGIYGTTIGYAGIDLDSQVASISIPGDGSAAYPPLDQPTESTLFGDDISESFATKQTMILVGAGLAALYILRN
tara:strand:+ start:486 stop:932 length:447 start_codon:yes stop_codon:yes gene_type:complete